MFGMSIWEILVVFALLFIVVGPGKLPGLAKKLGEQIRGLRASLADMKSTVDKDDEFVKAVSEARQSVNDAREAVRGIIDDVVSVTDNLGLDDVVRDRAPRPVPKGRKQVVRANPEGKAVGGGGRKGREARATGPGATRADALVEAEDWRASTREDRSAVIEDNRGDEVPEDRGAGLRADDGGVPRRTQPKSSTGRRMIKPGRNRDED